MTGTALRAEATAPPTAFAADIGGTWVRPGAAQWDPTKPAGLRQQAPLTPEYLKVFENNLAITAAGGQEYNPQVNCLPAGMPRVMIAYDPLEFIVTPETNYMRMVYMHENRRVYTDGRKWPDKIEPTCAGYSIGKWEGDRFVVDSIGFNDQTFIDAGGHPHTEAYHTTERFHRRDFGHLEYEITIDDPKAYTRPWKATIPFELFADNELMESVCENERDSQRLVGK